VTVLIAADDLAEIALLLRQQISCSPPRWLAINLFLVPASAAIPAATKQQNEDQNNDEKGSGVHVYLRVLISRALRTTHSNPNQRSGPHRVPSYSGTFLDGSPAHHHLNVHHSNNALMWRRIAITAGAVEIKIGSIGLLGQQTSF
jgi:hypothetical protein